MYRIIPLYRSASFMVFPCGLQYFVFISFYFFIEIPACTPHVHLVIHKIRYVQFSVYNNLVVYSIRISSEVFFLCFCDFPRFGSDIL